MTTRVYLPPATHHPLDTPIELDGAEAHYAIRVRRVRDQGAVIVMDGDGHQWDGVLLHHGSRKAAVRLLGERTPPPSPAAVRLHVGCPDVAACLELMTGACELGVHTVALIDTARSQRHRPSAERIQKTLRAAMRQCGRFAPPIVHVDTSLEQTLERLDASPRWFGDHQTIPSPHTGSPRGPCDLLVGPEGGFDARERANIVDAGFLPIRLSPWVLRTPTAALAIVAKTLEESRA